MQDYVEELLEDVSDLDQAFDQEDYLDECAEV